MPPPPVPATPRPLTNQAQTEPVAVLLEILARIEPELDHTVATTAIWQVAKTRTVQRRLAQALDADPGLLTSARPEGPPTIGDLIRALQPYGARHLVLPRCAGCGSQNELVCTDEQGRRICGGCYNRPRASMAACTQCGNVRRVRYRDRQGRPRCVRCPPEPDADHVEEICAHVLELDPDADVDRGLLQGLIAQALPQRFQQRAVAWELDAQPELLTGQGAHSSARVIRLLETLTRYEVAGVAGPSCPFCRRVERLKWRRDGQRCCRACYDEVRNEPCIRCQGRKPVATRTPAGQPLCRACLHREPHSQRRCTGCGRVRPVIHHGGGDGSQALCRACWRGHPVTCSVCGKRKPCHFAFTDTPRCASCSRRAKATVCSGCGRLKAVWARTPAGEPLCNGCSRRREPCVRCGRTMPVRSRLDEGALCTTCTRRDPAFFHPCSQCGSVERLHHYGLCERCACPVVLRKLLSKPDGTMRAELEPVFAALAANAPGPLLLWLGRTPARRLLPALAEGSGPVTHELLDQLTPIKAARHLRAILVNAKILPPRNEPLVGLDRWIDHKLTEVSDPEERRILRSFATWFHLRRLRTRAGAKPITDYQAATVRRDIKLAVKLLGWLHDQGLTLATCTQADIDTWLAEGPEIHKAARNFLVWAVARGHAHDVVIPVRHSNRVYAVLSETDQRWTLVRDLLHNTELNTVDRVAGLLVLLFAQPAGRIVGLTTDHVTTSSAGVRLTLGSKALELPPPLDELLLHLAANRRGKAVLGHTDDHPWLFPGGTPGRPLSPGRLLLRLKALGIPARVSRNTALMDLAGELPAAVLSQLLGLHVNTATRWTDEAGNTRHGYAAEFARRHERGHAANESDLSGAAR